MPKRIDLTNKRFGYWKVLNFDQVGTKNKARWICKCECGECDGITKSIGSVELRLGESRSCGSLLSRTTRERNYKHGQTEGGRPTQTYTSWSSMIQRCTNPKNPKYSYYGGRGIRVCDRWLSFANFFEDMGERSNNTSLDRMNPNGNYEPSNCIWATIIQQRAHQRPKGCIHQDELAQIAEHLVLDTKKIRQLVEHIGIVVMD